MLHGTVSHMLRPDEVNKILEILDKQLLFFIGRTVGGHLLTDQEKDLLKRNGIDVKKLMSQSNDLVSLNFHLGMLSDILSNEQLKNITYDQLSKYISQGKHIPLSAKERAVIQSIQMQSLADIRAARGRIFQDINNIVSGQLSSVRANQEEFVRKEIIEGIEGRKSRREIAAGIARKTGDWSRNFNKSVQYISHTAFNEGRGSLIERRNGSRARVYFQVQPDACESCKKLYLHPDGEPIVFTLSELQANGTNIGRKQKDWKPTVGALHVNCRCLITEFLEGSKWDGSRFVLERKEETKVARPLIPIEFNGKRYFV